MKSIFAILLLFTGTSAFGATFEFRPLLLAATCFPDRCENTMTGFPPERIEMVAETPSTGSGQWDYVEGERGYSLYVKYGPSLEGTREFWVSLYVGTGEEVEMKKYHLMANTSVLYQNKREPKTIRVMRPFQAINETDFESYGFGISDGALIEE